MLSTAKLWGLWPLTPRGRQQAGWPRLRAARLASLAEYAAGERATATHVIVTCDRVKC